MTYRWKKRLSKSFCLKSVSYALCLFNGNYHITNFICVCNVPFCIKHIQYLWSMKKCRTSFSFFAGGYFLTLIDNLVEDYCTWIGTENIEGIIIIMPSASKSTRCTKKDEPSSVVALESSNNTATGTTERSWKVITIDWRQSLEVEKVQGKY